MINRDTTINKKMLLFSSHLYQRVFFTIKIICIILLIQNKFNRRFCCTLKLFKIILTILINYEVLKYTQQILDQIFTVFKVLLTLLEHKFIIDNVVRKLKQLIIQQISHFL